MTAEPRFGVLERVAASSPTGWSHEAHDFTPWLADNLDLLGNELGLALELTGREHAVGRYSLDLLLSDAAGRVVIVENQFAQTDHDHLGKLLTYAAGTGAAVVIWIAESLTQEHAAALEWLNDVTDDSVGFFGVELELLRIGGSLPAPHFRVVVQPNDWKKRTRRHTRESVEWSWEGYAERLNVAPERIEVGKALVAAVEQAVEAAGLSWQPVFRQGYVAFQRASGYNVVIVDLWWNRAPRLAVKLPAAPAELQLDDPYPQLQASWAAADREWGWTVPDVALLPDVRAAIELTRPFQPASGPMKAPPAA